jgi:hypothetical protein
MPLAFFRMGLDVSFVIVLSTFFSGRPKYEWKDALQTP